MWNNLLSNAIKFTDPGENVAIRQKISEEYVEVEVSDSGCGMSKGSIRHIFDKFYHTFNKDTTKSEKNAANQAFSPR